MGTFQQHSTLSSLHLHTLHDWLRPVFRTIAGVALVVCVAEQLRHT